MKLRGLINLQQIRLFFGCVDLYYQRGQAVARAWPRKSTLPPSDAMLAQRARFRAVVAWTSARSAAQREAWRAFCGPYQGTWTDFAHRTLPPVYHDGALRTVPEFTTACTSTGLPPGRPKLLLSWDVVKYPNVLPLKLLFRRTTPGVDIVPWSFRRWEPEKGLSIIKVFLPTLSDFNPRSPILWNRHLGYAEFQLGPVDYYILGAFIDPGQTDPYRIQSPVRYFAPCSP
ncbi:MAG: hypothetical protein KAY24_00720 [Candidatus Eisenbacteria sp.]|nr:hypothetical protein [Candidatus Eisenbacteria bacterium]